MPQKKVSLRPEVDYYARVLVVDETGKLARTLIGQLLAKNCLVYYFGEARLAWLKPYLDKRNFYLISDSAEIERLTRLDYLFYFPVEGLTKDNQAMSLAAKTKARALVAGQWSFWNKQGKSLFAGVKQFNRRLVAYDLVFGPEVSLGYLEMDRLALGLERELFPVEIGVLTDNLIKILFNPLSGGKKYFLQPPRVTPRNFRRRLLDLGAKLDDPKHGLLPVELPQEKTTDFEVWRIDQNLTRKLQETLNWFQPQGSLDNKGLPQLKIKHRWSGLTAAAWPGWLNRRLVLVLIALFLLLNLFWGTPVAVRWLARRSLDDVFYVANDRKEWRLAQQAFSFFTRVTPWFKGELVLTRGFQFAGQYQRAVVTTRLVRQREDDLWRRFWQRERITSQDLSSMRTDLETAQDQLSLVQAQVNDLSVEDFFQWLDRKETYRQLPERLNGRKAALRSQQELLVVLDKWLGIGEKRTYLVLLQDNLELRPTGGFIVGYGLLRLEDGQVVDWRWAETEEADSRLRGRVEPPVIIRDYLGEKSWYLRDANWDPDFASSARRAQWFIEKELAVKTDGVIAVNFLFWQKLLEVVGAVRLPGQDQGVNSGSVMAYGVETETDRGYQVALARGVVDDLFSWATEDDRWGRLSEIFGQLLKQKEILLFANDPKAQQVITRLDWGGQIQVFSPENQQRVVDDYLLVNEANLAINRVNYDLSRQIDHQVVIDVGGAVREKLVLTYENKNRSQSASGVYRQYLRLYLPSDGEIASVSLSQDLSEGTWEPVDPQLISQSREASKTVVGFLVEVPADSRRQVRVIYRLARKLNLGQKVNSYLLLVQRQSGSARSGYRLTITYPRNLVPLRILPKGAVGDNVITINSILDQDRVFQVDFGQ